MNEYRIVFSPRARDRLQQIAAYLYQQNLSKKFVTEYLDRFERWLETVLLQFPECGTPMTEFGDDIRRVVYQHYSFVYRIRQSDIEILTIFRENRP